MKFLGYDPTPIEMLGWLAMFLTLCALVTLAGCGENRLRGLGGIVENRAPEIEWVCGESFRR